MNKSTPLYIIYLENEITEIAQLSQGTGYLGKVMILCFVIKLKDGETTASQLVIRGSKKASKRAKGIRKDEGS
jgi:hypothetical protein